MQITCLSVILWMLKYYGLTLSSKRYIKKSGRSRSRREFAFLTVPLMFIVQYPHIINYRQLSFTRVTNSMHRFARTIRCGGDWWLKLSQSSSSCTIIVFRQMSCRCESWVKRTLRDSHHNITASAHRSSRYNWNSLGLREGLHKLERICINPARYFLYN